MATLTVYPASIGTNNPVSGRALRSSVNETWATIIAGDGTVALMTGFLYIGGFSSSTTVNQFSQNNRSIVCFDTSSLTSSATISSAVLSFYGQAVVDTFSTPVNPSGNVYGATPVATNNLEAADYGNTASTAFCDTAIGSGSWGIESYNDFTFNATGIAAVSKTGISQFSGKNANYDVAGTSPTPWESSKAARLVAYNSNEAGTSKDPKLVITYTLPVGPANLKSYNTNLKANIKTINTNPIANVKTLDTNT